jgi:hypothetical protein
MARDNWAWIAARNPGTLERREGSYQTLSRSRYGSRLGSFWDSKTAQEMRVRRTRSGKVIRTSASGSEASAPVYGLAWDAKKGEFVRVRTG